MFTRRFHQVEADEAINGYQLPLQVVGRSQTDASLKAISPTVKLALIDRVHQSQQQRVLINGTAIRNSNEAWQPPPPHNAGIVGVPSR